MTEFKNYLIDKLFKNYGQYYDTFEEFKTHFDSGEVKISVADINNLVDEFVALPIQEENKEEKYPSELPSTTSNKTIEDCKHRWITACAKCGVSKDLEKPTVSEVEGHKIKT